MSPLRTAGSVTPLVLGPSLADELGALEQAHASRGPELSPELVRLGAALPDRKATLGAGEGPAIPLRTETLEQVTRIGAHLGRLERVLSELPRAEGDHVADRLARAQVLIDCAGALSALRASVHEALRTARPA